MTENLPFLREEMIPMDEVHKLMEGSFEHIAALVSEAVKTNKDLFLPEGSDGDVSCLATFPDKVVVGTSEGRYFEAVFKEKDGELIFESPQALDVPVVNQSNAAEYVRDFTLSAVDALLSEDVDAARGKILALASLQEDRHVQSERDYADDVVSHLGEARPWRHIMQDQSEEIRRQVVDQIESIRESQPEPKYRPMYETDEIPEENFEDYRELVNKDLSAVGERIERVQHDAETSFLPFFESISGVEMSEDEDEVLGHFCFFSEDLINDLQAIRQLVAEAVQNEQCVMCLGQIYDALAESLVDYEIAGAFVERMVRAFDEAA